MNRGGLKTFQSLAAIQKHPNEDKHSEADKKNPPMVRSRGNGRRPACHSIGDGYVQGRTSGKILTNNPKLAKWTLDGLFGKHKKQAPFLSKQRIIS